MFHENRRSPVCGGGLTGRRKRNGTNRRPLATRFDLWRRMSGPNPNRYPSAKMTGLLVTTVALISSAWAAIRASASSVAAPVVGNPCRRASAQNSARRSTRRWKREETHKGQRADRADPVAKEAADRNGRAASVRGGLRSLRPRKGRTSTLQSLPGRSTSESGYAVPADRVPGAREVRCPTGKAP